MQKKDCLTGGLFCLRTAAFQKSFLQTKQKTVWLV